MYTIKQEPEDFAVRELSSIVPQDSGRYTYFLLKKRNYNTEAAIQRIAKQLRMPRRFFGFAGNKDKRAVTEQLCSVSGNLRSFELKEISVEAVGRGDSPISLGDLYGNRFEIVVRNITGLPRKVSRVVNYFDSQRFGINDNNHLVGRSILKRDFRGATEQIIKDREDMATHLKLYPNDYIGVLRLLPKKVLTMYINAYQSDIWNRGVREYLDGRKEGNGRRDENEEFPLVGFGTEFKDAAIRGIVERLLMADGVKQRDFVIREIPELTSEGNSRRIFAEVSELAVGKLEEDELNNGMKKVTVKFTLGKGSYATIVIKEMFSG
jgi:tRNA pseudouridine13 synthase